MKLVPVLTIIILLATTAATQAYQDFNSDVRDEVVALFGTLLAPSIFTTAKVDQLAASAHGRVVTDEGMVPDFDGDFEDEIDEMTIYASGRLNGLGLTIGFGQGNDFEFSQPVILSADYMVSLINNPRSKARAAIDLQYSIITLPDEENIRLSALGFGVVSLNALASLEILNLLEPYGGLTLNYVYINSDIEGNIQVLKPVPKVGLRVTLLKTFSAATELMFIKNSQIDSAWVWNIGAGARF